MKGKVNFVFACSGLWLGLFGPALTGCEDDGGSPRDSGAESDADREGEDDGGETDASETDAGGGADAGGTPEPRGPLVIVTERSTPDSDIQYLHVLPDWPADHELKSRDAVEIGSYVLTHAQDGAVFVYQPEDASMQKYEVNEDLEITKGDKISFFDYGVAGYSADPIWVSSERAFLVDEASGQIILWNPKDMLIEGSVEIEPSVLTREGLDVQLQQKGVVTGGRAFSSASWRSWDTFEFVTGVALAYFDTSADQPEMRLIYDEDRRCAASGAAPFLDEDGNVYVMGDGALGFDLLASPKKTDLPQCVMRVRAGETSFDPDFFVDIQDATGSPGFYTAHPMPENKLLVNIWAPDVALGDVADPSDSSWYWSNPPYFEYAIVDLETGESTKVADLPRAGVQYSLTLRVDGINYVQTYDESESATLYRIDPDGTVTEVLTADQGTDIQYLGRL